MCHTGLPAFCRKQSLSCKQYVHMDKGNTSSVRWDNELPNWSGRAVPVFKLDTRAAHVLHATVLAVTGRASASYPTVPHKMFHSCC